MDTELKEVLNGLSPQQKEELERLERAKKDAEAAYDAFIERILKEHRDSKLVVPLPDNVDPKSLKTLAEAWTYTKLHILTDPRKRQRIQKLIAEQEDKIKQFEQLYHRWKPRNSRSLMDTLFKDAVQKLEEYTQHAHAELTALQVPLICTTEHYSQLSPEAKELIVLIQEEVNRM